METRTYDAATALSARRRLLQKPTLNSARNLQEEALIKHANKLTDRGIPPTTQILKNIAEELAKVKIGHNWVTRFCKRHRSHLASEYLRKIDCKRKVADN